MSSAVVSTAFAELFDGFSSQVNDLKGLSMLRNAGDSDHWCKKLTAMDHSLSSVEQKMTALKAYIARERESSESAKELQAEIKAQSARIQKLRDSAMAFIPESFESASRKPLDGNGPNKDGDKGPISEKRRAATKADSEKRPRKRVHVEQKHAMPTVAYITNKELEGCPVYLKGRLTVTRVNASVDELSEKFRDSYSLLTLNLSEMTNDQLHRYKMYQEMELPHVAAKNPFILLSELSGTKSCKQDTTGKGALSVLRHLGRISEEAIKGNKRIFTVGASSG